jgi:hypothetical protein
MKGPRHPTVSCATRIDRPRCALLDFRSERATGFVVFTIVVSCHVRHMFASELHFFNDQLVAVMSSYSSQLIADFHRPKVSQS